MKKYNSIDSTTVLGGSGMNKREMQFNFRDKGIMADMYSSIYTVPARSILIEYVTNAWEASKKAKSDKPIRVFAKKTEQGFVFGVQDFGTGLDAEGMEIFGTYAKSTKEEFEIGGHGIGCKSAFAITNEFFVYSVKDGAKIQAMFTREKGRVPNMIISEPFETEEENGTTVFMHLERNTIASILSYSSLLRYFDNVVFDVDSEFKHAIGEYSNYHFKTFSLSYVHENGNKRIVEATRSKLLIGKVLYDIPEDVYKASGKGHNNKTVPIDIHLDPSLIRTIPNREGIDLMGQIDGKPIVDYLGELVDKAVDEYYELVDSITPTSCPLDEWLEGKWDDLTFVYYPKYDISLPHYNKRKVEVYPEEIKRLLRWYDYADKNNIVIPGALNIIRTAGYYRNSQKKYYLNIINLFFTTHAVCSHYDRTLNVPNIISYYHNIIDGDITAYVTSKHSSNKSKEKYLQQKHDSTILILKEKEEVEEKLEADSRYERTLAKLLLEFKGIFLEKYIHDFDSVKVPKPKKVATTGSTRTYVRTKPDGWYLQKHRLNFNNESEITVESPDYYKTHQLRSKTILDATEYSDIEINHILHLSNRFVFFSAVKNSVRILNTVKLFRNYMKREELFASIKLDRDININLLRARYDKIDYSKRHIIKEIGGELYRICTEVEAYLKKYKETSDTTLDNTQLYYWRKISESLPKHLESREMLSKFDKVDIFIQNCPYSYHSRDKAKLYPLLNLLALRLRILPSAEFCNSNQLKTTLTDE